MKKRIPPGVLAKLCLYFSGGGWGRSHTRCAHTQGFRSALALFFKENPPEMVRYITLMMGQCWVLNDCRLKAEVSDKEMTVFLGQLNELVGAAYRYHKGSGGGDYRVGRLLM